MTGHLSIHPSVFVSHAWKIVPICKICKCLGEEMRGFFTSETLAYVVGSVLQGIALLWWATVAIAMAFILLLIVNAARAQDLKNWRPIERQCAAEIAAATQPPCGSCSAKWREVSVCVLDRAGVDIPDAELTRCFNIVNRADQAKPMSHDRVVDVIRCLGS